MPAIALLTPALSHCRAGSATQPKTAVVTLHTVGECRIVIAHAGATTTLTPASDRLFSLTLLLAAELGRAAPRARIAELLWPDLPPAAARHPLRQLLYRLRQLGVTVDSNDAHLSLAPQGVASPIPTDHDGGAITRRCLPGWDPPGDALGAWLERYRARVEAAVGSALARALTEAQAANRDGVALATALLELDPRHPLARATLPHVTAVRESLCPSASLPCIGRDELLSALRTRLFAACDGHGSAVVLGASPGAGTTRVLHELAATARALGVTTAPAAGSATVPQFAPTLAATVRTLVDQPGALGCSPDTLRTLRRFTANPTIPQGDATVRRLGATIADLARAVAAEAPLLLTIDARCDTPAERTLAATIAGAVANTPVLALFLTTPALGTSALLGSSAHGLALPPLLASDAAHLATLVARARGRALHADDLAWCVAMARGRPGDVITLANACTTRPGTRELPTTIATRLRADVAALPRRVRQVAALHALLGDTATADRIASTLDRRRIAVNAALTELHRARLPGWAGENCARLSPNLVTRVIGQMALATLDPADQTALATRTSAMRDATRCSLT